ncbi:MAG: Transcriptional regulator, Cro/CI family protein [Myxococcaceae bacterium]|nr:Transcriptional regulator, Cro/CI family protein [Myxococcaceae bacterium]
MSRDDSTLFSALLRHWRTRRGLSQLDLSLTAEVSSRHISFLETGRAQPSREMVLILAGSLDLPLRDQNVLLRAAGFQDQFAEPSWSEGLDPVIERTLERMLQKHEPFPMIVLSHGYDVVRANNAAARMMLWLTKDPSALSQPPNLMRALFDPRLARDYVLDWERVVRSLLTRIHRESISRPSDAELAALLRELLAYPDVPTSFRQPDLTQPSEATLSVRLKRGDRELSFLTTVTQFDAPQNITLQELKIESYFPLDDATERACAEL